MSHRATAGARPWRVSVGKALISAAIGSHVNRHLGTASASRRGTAMGIRRAGLPLGAALASAALPAALSR